MNKKLVDFLLHPYSQVICEDKEELIYLLNWAKNNNKNVSDWMWNHNKFPINIFLEGELVGWTDSSDRIGDKISLNDFFNLINDVECIHNCEDSLQGWRHLNIHEDGTRDCFFSSHYQKVRAAKIKKSS